LGHFGIRPACSRLAFLETVTYEYNLQNRLSKKVRSYTEDCNDIHEITEYTYKVDGIRVRKHSCTEINGNSENDDVTTVYLVDSHNHTGYAQTLEELVFNSADPDPLTDTPDDRITYTIGDDVGNRHAKQPRGSRKNRHVK
jgi:hypothetical protein